MQSKFGLNHNNSITFNTRYSEAFDEGKKIKILGIVTLEDVIEQIFNLEIMDEEDCEKFKKLKGGRGSNMGNPSMVSFYTNPDTRRTFVNETANEIKGIIKGLKNNIEMKGKIKDQMEKYNDDKRESLLNDQ